MILNTIAHTDAKTHRLVLDYADTFADLAVISPEDYQVLQEHIAQADEAEIAVAGIEARRAEATTSAATKLAANDITSAAITSAATKLATDQDVHDIALAVWRMHIAAAKAIVVAGVGAVPGVLTDALDRLSERGLTAAESLTGVDTAQEAISAGRVTEWSTLQSVAAEYSVIDRLVSSLRADNLLASPKPTDADRWAFRFRRPPTKVVRGGFRQTPFTDTEKRAILIEELRSEPYVPASRDEAQDVIAAHHAAELVSA